MFSKAVLHALWSKKEFDYFVMLYINRKVAMLFTIRYEGKYPPTSASLPGLLFSLLYLFPYKTEAYSSKITADAYIYLFIYQCSVLMFL